MQIILLERVAKLGQMGEVVTVKSGYARNFLIPKGKALRASDTTLKDFESRRVHLEAHNLERKQDAEKLAATIAGRSVVILRQASEASQLYGSVSPRDIAEAFAAAGVTFERAQMRLEQPLKTLGVHEVTVALHPEVEVQVNVNIARSAAEASVQSGEPQPSEDDDEEDLEADVVAAIEASIAAGS